MKINVNIKTEDKPVVELDPRIKADRIEYLGQLPKQKKKVVDRMRSYFNQQQIEVLDNLEAVGLPKQAPVGYKVDENWWINKVLFNSDKQNGILKGISIDISQTNILIGAEAIAKLLGVDPIDILNTPQVIDYIGKRSFIMLDVNKTTKKALRETLQQGLATGESLGELRERITQVYDQAKGFRAETIARTEVGSAQQYGRTEEMKSQKVERRVWVAIFVNTRDSHAQADGQIVQVDEAFQVGGESLMYPGDFSGSPENVINCQCSISPTLK